MKGIGIYMRVEQQQQQSKSSVIDFLQRGSTSEDVQGSTSFAVKAAKKNVSATGATSINMKDVTYLKPEMEEIKSVAEEVEKSSVLDAAERKNQMVVLSGTTSGEDYAKMQEEGFSLDSTTSNTIVTVTDKIKAELAKAGVDISCFGDDLDLEQIEEITGSAQLAAQIAAALQKADLPLTEENLTEAAEMQRLNEALKVPGDGAVKYMLDNGLSPTIENLYKAEFSGSISYVPGQKMNMDAVAGQVEAVIRGAALPVNAQTMADSQWLLENDIPLTGENLNYMEALKNLELPVDTEQLTAAMAQAVADGGRPKDAMLLPGFSLMDQAEHTAAVVDEATEADVDYLLEQGMDITVKNLEMARAKNKKESPLSDLDIYTRDGLARLTAQRQLEEVRLAMTAQANYALLKKGISIDTEPLAKLVEELKSEEDSYYAKLLQAQGAEATEENTSLFKETTQKVAELRYVPAYVLGGKEIDVPTVNTVHKAGMALKDTFERANERYETLMTAPRKDMGDSMQKAFQNVDVILEDLDLEVSEANRRAVRILGYNQLDITQESVAQMKLADEEVQRVFKNMTPSVVTEMIRKGINPLEMDFRRLNQIAEQIRKENGVEDAQKFSEYLWKLEQNRAISEEERSSFIGIYRLIHQVEDTDGAAIGALLHQGSEFTMKNLLTAVRSERRTGKIDISVDDVGSIESTGYAGISITDQIETAYQNNCLKDIADILTPERMRTVMAEAQNWEDMTPEQLKTALEQTLADEAETDAAYIREQLKLLQESAKLPEDIYRVLQKYDIPNTVNHIMAMGAMASNRNQMFRQIFGASVKDAHEEVGIDDLAKRKRELLEAFGEAVSTPAAMGEAQERLGELAENVMKGMLNSEDVTSLDVREMRLLSAKLSIGGALSKQEQYSVPVLVGDGVVNVSLKIVRGVGKTGIVDIMMESELRGKIAATFRAKEDGISGFVATDNRETKDLLAQNAEKMDARVFQEGERNAGIHYAYADDLDLNHFSMGMFGVKEDPVTGEASSTDVYSIQTARLYQIADSFIRQIRDIL